MPGVVVYSLIPALQSGLLWVQGQPELHTKFKVNLTCSNEPLSQKQTNKKGIFLIYLKLDLNENLLHVEYGSNIWTMIKNFLNDLVHI